MSEEEWGDIEDEKINAFEDLEELSKIDFPKPLSHEGVISLLSYLVENISSTVLVTYSMNRQGTISLDQGRLVDRARPNNLSGNIGIISQYGGTVPFECYRNEPEKEENGDFKFNGLEMLTSGFSNIAQIPRPYLRVMKLIKEKAEEFLESKK